MTKSKPSSALRWVVVRAGSCTVAASGRAATDLGAWSKRYGWVWAARFSGVHAPGSYRVGILSDPSAASPWFPVGPAAQVYAKPLANALYFYQQRAGRPGLHPHRAAHRARSPERRQRDDLPDPAGGRERRLQGQPGQVRDRGTDQRHRRLVGRGRLPALRRDDQLRRGHPAAGHRVLPGPDGRRVQRGLHRRGQVRPGLPAADVAPEHQDALLPGGHRRGQQLLLRRPRHLAAAPGRRPLQGDEPAVRVHPAPAGVPRRPAGRAAQPQPGRPADRRLRALLPGVPHVRPGLRGPLPDRGEDGVLAGQHALEGPADDGHPVRLLPGDELAGRHDAGRHRTGHRAARRGPAGHRLPARRRALGQRLDPQQAGAVRHAEPVRRERAGRLRARPGAAQPARRRAWR